VGFLEGYEIYVHSSYVMGNKVDVGSRVGFDVIRLSDFVEMMQIGNKVR